MPALKEPYATAVRFQVDSRTGVLKLNWLRTQAGTPSGMQMLTLVSSLARKFGTCVELQDASQIHGLDQRLHGALSPGGHQSYYERKRVMNGAGFTYKLAAERDVITAALRGAPLSKACPAFFALARHAGLTEPINVGDAYAALAGIDFAACRDTFGIADKFSAYKQAIEELQKDRTVMIQCPLPALQPAPQPALQRLEDIGLRATCTVSQAIVEMTSPSMSMMVLGVAAPGFAADADDADDASGMLRID